MPGFLPGSFYFIQKLTFASRFYFTNEPEVTFYAEATNLSIRRINELVVNVTGQTVTKHLINRLVTETIRNIAKGSKSYRKIAYDLVFNVLRPSPGRH